MIFNNELIKACDNIFESALGKKVYSEILKCIDDFGMEEKLLKGSVLGLSGGADSVLLLIFLWKFKKQHSFNIKAVHINHMIRGDDANSDEQFSKHVSEALGIDFASYAYDVPKLAAQNKTGVEETARAVRYEAFALCLSQAYHTVVTAHNATDNLETLIFNLMRGSGTSGLCAIAPVRDNIVRPLLYVSKEDITTLLTEAGIPFCCDKTNNSVEYTRNYIRHEILPKFKRLTPAPEEAAARAIANLRCDDQFIEDYSKKFLLENLQSSQVSRLALSKLHKSVFSRVVRMMANEYTSKIPEKKHYDALYEAVNAKKRFEIDLPGKIAFLSDGEFCRISPQEDVSEKVSEICVTLKEGFNEIPQLGIAIGISSGKCEVFSSNVYKFSMKVSLSSAIIFGDMYLRTKKDGDSYRYGGLTRKLKKLFNDKKIPPEKRDSIPILCDGRGIVWVMGFGVRDDEPTQKTEKWLTVYKKTL